MQLPNFTCYCDNTTPANALCFSLGNGVDVYFSYKTPVAFRAPNVNGGRVVVHENVWGPTTGKHLNAIDKGRKGTDANKARVDGDTFDRMLGEALARKDSDELRKAARDEASCLRADSDKMSKGESGPAPSELDDVAALLTRLADAL